MPSRGDLNQREREREREREKKKTKRRQRNQAKKTKQKQQVREVCLDVGAVVGVRIEEEERGRVNTRGTTNRHGLCFPSAWREEEEKRDDGEQQNNQTTRKRERERDTSHNANTGRVLKGQTKTYKESLLQSENTRRAQKPKIMKAKTPKRNQRSEKQRIGGVAGPMGCPAPFRGRSWVS